MSLVVVGSVAYDKIETPSRPEGIRVLGGSATYFSVAASFFTKPKMVGIVGEDFAEADIKFLNERGVDTSGITRQKGKTFFWHGRYHENMEDRDSLDTQLNVFQGFKPDLPDDMRSPDILFLGNIAPVLQLEVLDQMKNRPFVAADTIDLWINTALDKLIEVISRVDLFFLNEDEAFRITRKDSILSAAHALLDLGPRAVIIKRGDAGAILFEREGWGFIPAWPLEEVTDPTGAGDTFAGGLLGFLDKTGDYSPDAIRAGLVTGSVVASFCVEGFGPRHLASTDPDELKKRARGFIDAGRIDEDMLTGLIK